jgi:serine/threonine-protein kinase
VAQTPADSETIPTAVEEHVKPIGERPTKLLVADEPERLGETRPVNETPLASDVPSVSHSSYAALSRRSKPPEPLSTETQIRQITASRIRITIVVLLAVMPLGLLSVWFARETWVSVMGTVSLFLVAGGLLLLLRYGTLPPDHVDRRKYHIVAFSMAVSVVPLLYTMGTYTGFAGVLGMFVLLYDMSAPPKNALLVTATVGSLHVVIHALVATGVVPDLGVMALDGSEGQRGLSILGVLSVYVLAFTAGQVIRRQTQKTLTKLGHAAQQVALREAMLREARLALQEAGGIGQTGRFSDQVFGNFEIGVVLGRGGMGEIYEAVDVRDKSPAAVKLLRTPTSGDDKAWDRFVREAQIVASLSSPHVVRVLEVSEQGPFPYIAMERLSGRDLSQHLREEPLSPREVADMVMQCAEGLFAAHEKAIVHRDVKPHNLFRCDDGVWKVLDFGVARLFDGSETLTQNLVGTPAYMAPEQLRQDLPADHRTDIHALGVVSYRALTGHPAFGGRDVATVLHRVSSKLPARPTSLVSVSPAVCDVLRIALAKDPADRFDDVRDFSRSLSRALIEAAIDPHLSNRAAALDTRLTWSRGRAPE